MNSFSLVYSSSMQLPHFSSYFHFILIFEVSPYAFWVNKKKIMKQNNCISFHIYLPFFLSYVWSSDHKYMVENCMHMHLHTSVEIITIKEKQIKIQCSISVFLYHFQLHLIKLNRMHGISTIFFAYFSKLFLPKLRTRFNVQFDGIFQSKMLKIVQRWFLCIDELWMFF